MRRIFSVFISKNCLQYFYVLLTKTTILWCHSTKKMISGTRRIFYVFISKSGSPPGESEWWSPSRGVRVGESESGVRVGEPESGNPNPGARIWESEFGNPNPGARIWESEFGNLNLIHTGNRYMWHMHIIYVHIHMKHTWCIHMIYIWYTHDTHMIHTWYIHTYDTQDDLGMF